jgi:hypothetical protein
MIKHFWQMWVPTVDPMRSSCSQRFYSEKFLCSKSLWSKFLHFQVPTVQRFNGAISYGSKVPRPKAYGVKSHGPKFLRVQSFYGQVRSGWVRLDMMKGLVILWGCEDTNFEPAGILNRWNFEPVGILKHRNFQPGENFELLELWG